MKQIVQALKSERRALARQMKAVESMLKKAGAQAGKRKQRKAGKKTEKKAGAAAVTKRATAKKPATHAAPGAERSSSVEAKRAKRAALLATEAE